MVQAAITDVISPAITTNNPNAFLDESVGETQEVARFFRSLEALDAYLASDATLGWSAERLFQGPIADALTHTGQLTMLRRLAGAPVRGENYARAMITAGTVGMAQGAPAAEFD